MRSFSWLPVLLCLAPAAAAAQEDPAPAAMLDTPALLSAGGGVGTYMDASSLGAQINVAVALWATPEWTVDLNGAVYPLLAPSLGPTYHLALFDTPEVAHVALIGLTTGLLSRFQAVDGPRSVDPTLGAQVGYGLQTSGMDIRCTVALARDVRNLAANDYFATVSLSVAKLIHSSSPED